jgi:hypothetical protein
MGLMTFEKAFGLETNVRDNYKDCRIYSDFVYIC